MKIKKLLRKELLVELLISLFILLFVYASVSKLLDFESFKAQIGQSPVLTSFADFLVWAVPIGELIVVLLLILPKYRFIGLMSFYSMMVMFTTYIIVILNFSDFVPCSCGGILEALSWNQHLVLNVLFCLLSLYLILIDNSITTNHTRNTGTFIKKSI